MNIIRLARKLFKHEIVLNILMIIFVAVFWVQTMSFFCFMNSADRFGKQFEDDYWNHVSIIGIYNIWNHWISVENMIIPYRDLVDSAASMENESNIKHCTVPLCYTMSDDNTDYMFEGVDYGKEILNNINFNIVSGRKALPDEENVVIMPEHFKEYYSLEDEYDFVFHDGGDLNKSQTVRLKVIGFYDKALSLGTASSLSSADSYNFASVGGSELLLYNVKISGEPLITPKILPLVFVEHSDELSLSTVTDYINTEVVMRVLPVKEYLRNMDTEYGITLDECIEDLIIHISIAISFVVANTFMELRMKKKDISIYYCLGLSRFRIYISYFLAKLVTLSLGALIGTYYYYNMCLNDFGVSGSSIIFADLYWNVDYVIFSFIIMVVLLVLGFIPFIIFTKNAEKGF